MSQRMRGIGRVTPGNFVRSVSWEISTTLFQSFQKLIFLSVHFTDLTFYSLLVAAQE